MQQWSQETCTAAHKLTWLLKNEFSLKFSPLPILPLTTAIKVHLQEPPGTATREDEYEQRLCDSSADVRPKFESSHPTLPCSPSQSSEEFDFMLSSLLFSSNDAAGVWICTWELWECVLVSSMQRTLDTHLSRRHIKIECCALWCIIYRCAGDEIARWHCLLVCRMLECNDPISITCLQDARSRGQRRAGERAQNVAVKDECASSDWFDARHGHRSRI